MDEEIDYSQPDTAISITTYDLSGSYVTMGCTTHANSTLCFLIDPTYENNFSIIFLIPYELAIHYSVTSLFHIYDFLKTPRHLTEKI